MFGRKIQRTAAAISAAGKAPFNPYKALKPWPPDFTRLDLKYQFRLERRYRRRAKLKYNRPGWIKGVKLAQWGICLSVFVYGVLFMDVGENENPFTGIREWFGLQSRSIWTTESAPQSDTAPDDAALQAPSSNSTVLP